MNKRMKSAVLGLSLALGMAGATAPIETAQAAPPAVASGSLIFGVNTPADSPVLDQVQYLWGGRNYCWYPGGWRGPGWYWCGYAWRRGFGWGGPDGWRGWRGGPGWRGRGPGWHGGWRGGHGGWHGGHGGWHGGGHPGGGHDRH